MAERKNVPATRPQTLDYAPPASDEHRVAFYASFILYVSGLAWSAYLLGALRTQSFGFEWRFLLADLVVTAFFTIAPGIVAFFTTARRGWRVAIVVLFLVPTFAAEGWALTEEAMILRKHGRQPTAVVMGARAWPYESNYYVYEPGHGWYGGD